MYELAITYDAADRQDGEQFIHIAAVFLALLGDGQPRYETGREMTSESARSNLGHSPRSGRIARTS